MASGVELDWKVSHSFVPFLVSGHRASASMPYAPLVLPQGIPVVRQQQLNKTVHKTMHTAEQYLHVRYLHVRFVFQEMATSLPLGLQHGHTVPLLGSF